MFGRHPGATPNTGLGQNQGIGKYLGPLLGGSMLGAGLGGLFGGNKNPYDAGNPFYERIMKELPQYFQPWMGAGQRALPGLEQQYGQLISSPGEMLSKFGAGYKESPGYQWRQQQGQQAALNQAAAGGMAGSPQAQQQAAQVSEDIANQDFMNYLQNVMGLYGMGLGGLGDISKQGLLGSMGLGEDIASILSRQAEGAIRGEELGQRESGMNWGNILGGLAGLAGIAGLFL